MPIIVGNTERLLPDLPVPVRQDSGRQRPPVPPEAVAKCGCTYPNCQAGEELVCAGQDNCMGPCSCRPARGICKDDTTCGAGKILRPVGLPVAADDHHDDGSRRAPECDPLEVRPEAGDSQRSRAPNGEAPSPVPTGRCLLNADGSCGWETRECPPTRGCYGICVPNTPQTGCQVDTDCPMGQALRRAVQGLVVRARRHGQQRRRHADDDDADSSATGNLVPPTPPAPCACDLDRQQLQLRRQRRVQGADGASASACR